MIEVLALVVAGLSAIFSAFFAIRSLQSSDKANELSESQKTAALISIVAPACQSPEQWRMFIEYLSRHNRLPNFSEEDEFFLSNVLNRLEIKASIVNGRLRVEN